MLLRAAVKAGWLVAHQCGWAQDSGRLLDKSRSAADGSGDARAFVEGARLESFSVLVVDSVQVAAHCHHVCKKHRSDIKARIDA